MRTNNDFEEKKLYVVTTVSGNEYSIVVEGYEFKEKTLAFGNHDVIIPHNFIPVIVFNVEQYESFIIKEITEDVKIDILAHPDLYIMG
ncbi:hypothetical protein [Butyrivibrio sp.]|uniref:hypothetical protein n=1 Tax=Butyrivibrio sp. TaxID=28121 RepID=UPI0025BC2C82|nr:hypothetical protein [Butyrivibrio sp.]MBQ7431320.1 hypothetical protein [Butyrivibrio sp.]MBQ9302740.1 hypothetical protein [Butyrivibrio sp.]